MYCVLSGVSAKQNNRNALRRLNTIPRIVLHTLQSFLCVFFFPQLCSFESRCKQGPWGVLGDISLSVCVTPRFSLPEVLCWDWALCCRVSGSLALGDYSSLGHWTCRSVCCPSREVDVDRWSDSHLVCLARLPLWASGPWKPTKVAWLSSRRRTLRMSMFFLVLFSFTALEKYKNRS